MKIIAFAGMPCSGKSEAVQIAKEMNIIVIRMGDMVWEEVKKRGLTLDEKVVIASSCPIEPSQSVMVIPAALNASLTSGSSSNPSGSSQKVGIPPSSETRSFTMY